MLLIILLRAVVVVVLPTVVVVVPATVVVAVLPEYGGCGAPGRGCCSLPLNSNRAGHP